MNDIKVLDPKRAAIRDFTAAGYTLIPLNGKIPVVKDWTAVTFGRYGEKDLAGNYGVVLHDGDLVVDVDPRNFPAGEDPLARLKEMVGPLGGTFVVRTGGGGLHIYFTKPADLPISQALPDLPGIEIKTTGRQVVGPGSLHTGSGKLYEIVKGSPLEVAAAPEKLLELLKKEEAPLPSAGTSHYVDDEATRGRFLCYLREVALPSIQGQNGDHNAFRVACHGRDLGLSPAATLDLMLDDWNPRCLPPWAPDELRTKVANAYQFASGAVGSAHPSATFEVVAEKPEKAKEAPIEWVTQGPSKKIVKCLKNCMNYLRLPASGLHKIFAFNELTGRIEFVLPAPWHDKRMPIYRGVGDHDLQLLRGYLATEHHYESGPKDIEDAITNTAYNERFHPIREYLEGLVWDQTPRVNTWMRDFLGAVDGGYPEYLAAVSRKVLCAAVLRAVKPGTEFHHVVVLEGPQDIGKSATCKILGGPWASDAPVDPHSRDTIDAMQGRWIIEMAEMETLRKTDEDALKAFITRQTDRARLAYGRSTGEYPRQSIFIATKNPKADGTYLKDETGNRRWWPVRCEPKVDKATGLAQIDFKGLAAARNQLFAEAMHVVKTPPGEKLSMDTPLLKAQAAAVVGLRHAEHEWTERIAGWIAECDKKPETRRDFLTSRVIYIDAMNGSDAQLNHKVTTSIATVLRSLGWVPKLKWLEGRPVRGYTRAAVESASPMSSVAV